MRILTCLAIFLATFLAIAAEDVEIALEAELANKIRPPVVVAEDENASNGQYIWGEGNDGEGWAEFIVNIPKDDTYTVWGRVIARDSGSDSFYVTWMPADPEENPQQTENRKFAWSGIDIGDSWHWERVNGLDHPAIHDREWEFVKGETLLKIWVREAGTMLDCLFITNNLSTLETSAGVRLPNDTDRRVQIYGEKAIDPKEKLSTTWAKIKYDCNS